MSFLGVSWTSAVQGGENFTSAPPLRAEAQKVKKKMAIVPSLDGGAGRVGGGIGSTLRVRGVLRSTFNVTQLIPSAEQPLPVDPLGHEQEWLGYPQNGSEKRAEREKRKVQPPWRSWFQKGPNCVRIRPWSLFISSHWSVACSLSLEVFLPGSLGEGVVFILFPWDGWDGG